jgi:hypothetical protein
MQGGLRHAAGACVAVLVLACRGGCAVARVVWCCIARQGVMGAHDVHDRRGHTRGACANTTNAGY